MQIPADSLFARYQSGTQARFESNRLSTATDSVGTTGSVDQAMPFMDLLRSGVGKVNEMQLDANEGVEQLLTGGDVRPAEVLTGIQKADMSFRLLVQVRNKLMQAFEEINNIRV